MSSRPLTELFGVVADTQLNADYQNRLLAELQGRISELQILKLGLDAAISQAQEITLDRINEVLVPAVATVNGMISTLTGLLATAEADLTAGTADALAAVQPQIDAALADVDAATSAANSAASTANAAAAGITYLTINPRSFLTGNVTATRGGVYWCNTTSGAITVTLPATPSNGDLVTVRRVGANSAIVGRNGSTIGGSAADLTIDTDKRGVVLEYAFTDWRVFPEVFA